MMMLVFHALAGMAGKTLQRTVSPELNWSVETYKKHMAQGARPQLLSVLLATEPASPQADLSSSSSPGVSCFVIPERIDFEYRIC